MKLYEYQAKEIFRRYDIPCPREKLITSVDEGLEVVLEIGFPCVLKAQVLVGGRGKAGGVRIVEREEDFKKDLEGIFALKIKGLPVQKVLISEMVEIERELYLSIILDRNIAKPLIIASLAGGMDVEEIAQKRPKALLKEEIDPLLGILPFKSRTIGFRLFFEEKTILEIKRFDYVDKFSSILSALVKVFFDYDATLVEINPLVITREDKFIALDAKILLDDNALFRHKDWQEYEANEDLTELAAKREGLSYVKLDGEIGSIVNGAGLAMATLDLINRYGATAANFLDIGGSSSPQKTKRALEIITQDAKVKVILVNIFGGITRCDDVAQGILDFLKEREIKIPIICRLVGTNQDKAEVMLRDKPVLFITTMKEAVKRASELVISSSL